MMYYLTSACKRHSTAKQSEEQLDQLMSACCCHQSLQCWQTGCLNGHAMGQIAWTPTYQGWFSYYNFPMFKLLKTESVTDLLTWHHPSRRPTSCLLESWLYYTPSTLEEAVMHLEWNWHIVQAWDCLCCPQVLANTTSVTEYKPLSSQSSHYNSVGRKALLADLSSTLLILGMTWGGRKLRKVGDGRGERDGGKRRKKMMW